LTVGGVFEALSLREITKTISQASMLWTGFFSAVCGCENRLCGNWFFRPGAQSNV